MGLRDRLGLGAVAPRPATPFPAALDREGWHGKPPVGPSEDLNRIVALPRRELAASWSAADVAALEARLKLPPREVRCICASLGRDCPEHLQPHQAHALLEAGRVGGLVAAMGVGKGKTLVDLLLPWTMGSKTAVLLVPAALVKQLIDRDWDYYGGHWRLPQLVDGAFFHPGPPRPILHVISYERLSRQEGADLLARIKPDLIICDEAQKLKTRKSGRTLRVERLIHAMTPRPRIAILSGTVASRGIADGAHLSDWALQAGSPFPRQAGTVEEWGRALDPLVNDEEPAAMPGALERLEPEGFDAHLTDEDRRSLNGRARVAFRLRRNSTPGVVATSTSAFDGSLLIRKRVPEMPEAIGPLIERAWAGERPDGEEAEEKLQCAQWVRQLSCGFFHRWRFPRGEPEELIKKWRAARKEWNREVRQKLEHPAEFMDTPGLLKNAARRFHDPSYRDSLSPDEKINRRAGSNYWGKLPVWRSVHYPAWAEVEPLVQPVPSLVWLDKGCPEVPPIPGADFLIRDAVEWITKEGPGIVWSEFPELGERVAKTAGVPWFGGGQRASNEIVVETGKRSIVASMHAHREGKNLQYAFSRNYVLSPLSDAGAHEQLIGRTHRPGQKADEVIVDYAMHTEEFERSFAFARERARFADQTDGQKQKLLLADYEWD